MSLKQSVRIVILTPLLEWPNVVFITVYLYMNVNMYRCICLHTTLFDIHKLYRHILANMMTKMKDYCILMC